MSAVLASARQLDLAAVPARPLNLQLRIDSTGRWLDVWTYVMRRARGEPNCVSIMRASSKVEHSCIRHWGELGSWELVLNADGVAHTVISVTAVDAARISAELGIVVEERA